MDKLKIYKADEVHLREHDIPSYYRKLSNHRQNTHKKRSRDGRHHLFQAFHSSHERYMKYIFIMGN